MHSDIKQKTEAEFSNATTQGEELEVVDIYKYPTQISNIKDSDEITIGDMHASFKFIYFLVRHGILEISQSEYDELVQIYKRHLAISNDLIDLHVATQHLPTQENLQLSMQEHNKNLQQGDNNYRDTTVTDKKVNHLRTIKQHAESELNDRAFENSINNDIKRFNSILNKAQIKNHPYIRLIGDELADRGASDYFILSILRKLKSANVNVEILLSNHSIEFLEALEKKISLAPQYIPDAQANSMLSLQYLINKRIVSQEEINNMVDVAYKPSLRLLSYNLDPSNNKINIHSHALIDIELIQDLAEKFKVSYKDSTIFELANTIDKINDEFSLYVHNNKIHELHTVVGTEDLTPANAEDLTPAQIAAQIIAQIKRAHPIDFLINNRKTVEINLDRPPSHPTHNYRLEWTHGHHPNSPDPAAPPVPPHIINLDNLLGKYEHDVYDGDTHNNKEEYNYSSAPHHSLRTLTASNLVTQIKTLKQDYQALGRKTHKKDLDKLIMALENIINSPEKSPLAKQQAIIVAIEEAFKNEMNNYRKPFLMGNWRTSEAFIKRINQPKNDYHYPRLLGIVLQQIYNQAPIPNMPTERNKLKFLVAQITIPPKEFYQKKIPVTLGPRYDGTYQEIEASLMTKGFSHNDIYRIYLGEEDITKNQIDQILSAKDQSDIATLKELHEKHDTMYSSEETYRSSVKHT